MIEEKVRQLAAIMFTDIVGYTALMQGDEEVAANVRSRHRKIFEHQHLLHQGRIIQYYGDGTLSVFNSAISAAKCAIEIQLHLKESGPVPLRIGLHLGDIVFDKTEIYGDGVNFASRIESLSVAGAILLSKTFNDELKNHRTISNVSLGHFELKNITLPVEVFAITNADIVVPGPSDLSGKQKTSNKTIAVLPFINMSSNQENEYFSDGITVEIINALSKIKNIKVTSRNSSFFFKNNQTPIKDIAKELGVSAVLEGSVRRSGDTVRITAQLVQAREDFTFWSETWDRKLINLFEVQDEISLLIANKLRTYFGHFEIQEHLVAMQTNNIAAYEFYLKARFHAYKWNPEDMRTAISYYEKALELDPKHSESYIGLADCYGFMATSGFMPYEETWTKTQQLTAKALSINNELPEAHNQLARLAFFTDSNFGKAFKHTAKAISLKPNYVEAQQFISFLYIISGDQKKSLEHLNICLSIDPLSTETLFFEAYFHYMVGDYAVALEKLDQCINFNPKSLPAHSVKCNCLLKLGRYQEVIDYFGKIPADIVVEGEKLGLTAIAYAMKGDATNASKFISKLLTEAKEVNGFRALTHLLTVYAVLGKKNKAFECIRLCIEKKSSLLLFIFADPLLDRIKDDLRYQKFHRIIYKQDLTLDS